MNDLGLPPLMESPKMWDLTRQNASICGINKTRQDPCTSQNPEKCRSLGSLAVAFQLSYMKHKGYLVYLVNELYNPTSSSK